MDLNVFVYPIIVCVVKILSKFYVNRTSKSLNIVLVISKNEIFREIFSKENSICIHTLQFTYYFFFSKLHCDEEKLEFVM